MTSTTRPDPLVDIVGDVLARAERVLGLETAPAAHRTARARLGRMVADQRDRAADPGVAAACAATANLVGLGVLGDTADLIATSELAGLLGHERLARLQHRHGWQLESDPTLPVATAAVRTLLGEEVRDRADAVADTCLRAAYALLRQGVDPTRVAPPLESLEEYVDLAEDGTITEWRQLLAMVLESPWSPETQQLVELAAASGRPHAASVVAALVDLCRAEQEQAERDEVAREVGRLVRSSGVPADELAGRAGLVPGHLESWASGAVMPSAAQMLRIARTSAALQRRAALDPPGRRWLLSVPGRRAPRAVG
ncbi:MAG TPA: hypothetical protein VNS55_15355 [Nocardioides sp.]|nr:hypothetical protein [Nocardioides sp.]